MRCKLSVIAVVTATLAMPATALGLGMGGGHGGHFGGAHAHAHFGHIRVAGGHGRHGRYSESSCFIIFEPFCRMADAFRR